MACVVHNNSSYESKHKRVIGKLMFKLGSIKKVKMHGKLRIYVNEDQSQDQARLRLNLQSDAYALYSYDA